MKSELDDVEIQNYESLTEKYSADSVLKVKEYSYGFISQFKFSNP